MHKIPVTLRNRLLQGKVIPFIGAGVSLTVERVEDATRARTSTSNRLFPSWKDLLLRGADYLENENMETGAEIVRKNIDVKSRETPSYKGAAERLYRDLKSMRWIEFIKKELDPPLNAARDRSLALARSIWQLGSNLIITTNYDWVMHWACPQPHELRTWNIEVPAEQMQHISDGVARPTVWHLHGHVDDPLKLVITSSSYDGLYGIDPEVFASRYPRAIELLKTLFASHTFLFIGFSFEDADLGTELVRIDKLFSNCTGTHFAIVHEGEEQQIKNKFSMLNLALDTIVFREFGDPLQDTVNLLTDIVDRTDKKSSTATNQTIADKRTNQSLADLDIYVDLITDGTKSALAYRINSTIQEMALEEKVILGEDFSNLQAGLKRLLRRVEMMNYGKDIDGRLLLASEIEEKLATIGRRLYHHILPRKFRSLYKKYRNQINSMHFISNLTYIPWEIVRPYDDSNTQDVIDDDFWGNVFQITRWHPDIDPPSPTIHLERFASLSTDSSYLPFAQQEKFVVDALLSEYAIEMHPDLGRTEMTYGEFISILKSEDINLLHIVGNATGITENTYELGIAMIDGMVLQTEELLGPVGFKMAQNQTFCFFNIAGGSAGWAEVWTTRIKGGFVGPQWITTDKYAYEFVKSFYEALVNGSTFGQAAQRARVQTREASGAGDPTWLAFTVFAHPDGRFELNKREQFPERSPDR